VQGFVAFCGKPLAEVTLADLQAWQSSMTGVAPATQARRLAAVKSLLTFGHRVGHLAADVGQLLQTKKPPAGASDRILTEAEINRLVGAETDPRDRALLRLLYIAGLRASEAAGLRWKHLTRQKKGGEATVLGKGNKVRTVGLTAALWAEIAALTPSPKPDSPVIPARAGGPINRQVVHRIVKRAARRAGLDRKVSPHWLRHSHASHALDRGAPPHVVQNSLGHASLATTTKYAHIRKGDASSKYLAE
jgi:integrase/recombinase XerD